jgi:16S rRNA (uracil1498-N3)-methyltransferase
VNLLLLRSAELTPQGYARLEGARARHLLNVLNVVPEQTVRVGVVDGPRGIGRVVAVGAGQVELICELDSPAAEAPAVDLLLALPRPKVLQRLWAQIAALGVGQVMLTNAEKVGRHYFDTHVLEPGVYEPLLIEGLQQAQDTRLPRVSVHRRFRILVEDHLDTLAPQRRRLVAEPHATASVGDAVRAGGAGRVLLAVGPEGGWNRFELDLLAAHGFLAASIGGRTLRSDTACIALLALVHDAIRSETVLQR